MLQGNIRVTLTEFLIAERRRYPKATGDFNALLLSVALSCKIISRMVSMGALGGALGDQHNGGTAEINVQGEVQKKLDVMSNDTFLKMNEWGGHLAGMASEEMEHPWPIPKQYPRGRYLLVFDPLDGSSNIDVNVSVGSIFSILRTADIQQTTDTIPDVEEQDFLQPGSEQVAAGYAIYGPNTMLVLSVGNGVHGFTLDPVLGEFFLTHPDMMIPEDTNEFAINTSNSRFWEEPVKRYVDECLAGKTGIREKDFNMRWIASMVAEAHRILTRGGVFMYPKDNKDPTKEGRLRLLYEACPVGFLIEQAGGRATTGREPILSVQPKSLHQRIGFIFGSKHEIERIESYHLEQQDSDGRYTSPLFQHTSLFRNQE